MSISYDAFWGKINKLNYYMDAYHKVTLSPEDWEHLVNVNAFQAEIVELLVEAADYLKELPPLTAPSPTT